MKTALALALLLLAGTAKADSSWTAANTVLEAAFIAAVAVDVMQTSTPGFREEAPYGPLFVRNGIVDRDRLLLVSAGGIILHAAISAVLPRPYRELWQGASLTVEAANVAGNFMAGGRLTFPF